MKEGQYYAKAVTWAYENGIAMGMTETLFAPNCAATREQIVTFLYRYARLAGLDVSTRGDLAAFPDSSARVQLRKGYRFLGGLEQDSW